MATFRSTMYGPRGAAYVYGGRACVVVNCSVSNRRGYASYTVYTVEYADTAERESIPAGKFNGSARVACCGKTAARCRCGWDLS